MKDKIRSAAAALLFLVCLVTLTSALNLPNRSPDLSSQLASVSTAAKPAQQRTTLTLADRVAYQRAIEEVYWRHRIWPKDRPDQKPSLDAVISQAQLEKKVTDYLRNSQALEDYWKEPLTTEQLQAEMDRMAQHTKQPEVLRELFAALGNDPFVIAECLVRPALSERLLTNLYAHDQRFHGELKRRAEADLQTHPSVRQMKQMSGMYTELEWIKSDTLNANSGRANTKSVEAVKMNGNEWQESVEKLAQEFGFGVRSRQRGIAAFESADMSAHSKNAAADVYETLSVGKVSPLQEDEGHYYSVAVMKKGKDRLKLVTIAWLKEPLQLWLAKAETQAPVTMAAVSANYALPVIATPSGGCIDDSWTATSTTNAPAGRYGHTAVWTGSEMIVWGGVNSFGPLATGGRYNPSTDSWTATNLVNVPATRKLHTAVWTGSEMIVWGGDADFYSYSYFNSGGRYNPSTNSWTATSLTNAPSARTEHTAVWSGSEMIVWGGYNGSNLSTGGRYNPNTDSWTVTSTTNAPDPRADHTAVWTGSEMIIWGGYNGCNLNTGGRYDPSTDSWTVTDGTGAPAGRTYHTAVWSGSEMIVWGGYDGLYLNTGGRYNPSADSWTVTSTTNVPDGRYWHRAVWIGSEMIVWGGWNGSGYLNTGGRYNPGTDSWTVTSGTNAPATRTFHTAVWTGSQMIVWGGWNGSYLNTGGRYCAAAQATTPTPTLTASSTATPSPTASPRPTPTPRATRMSTGGCINDSWTPTITANAPDARDGHTAVWTGSEMIIWGGSNFSSPYELNTGGRYTPSTDSWTATSLVNAPANRTGHTAVWTGNEMIVWGGGGNGSPFPQINTGGRYNPTTDSWACVTTNNAPSARDSHTAVWTGSEMIVWGGFSDPDDWFNTGGRYNPSTDSWTATSTTNAPEARWDHTAVWTGSEMIVWGGTNQTIYLNTGGRYNPSTDAWTPTGLANAPLGRIGYTAVWTGSEMIVWGGTDSTFNDCNTGGRYDPSTDSWVATTLGNAPSTRDSHSAVWTGSEMIVWGGIHVVGGAGVDLNTGGRYNPASDGWTPTTTTNAPEVREYHSAVWTGSEMIVWAGYDINNPNFFLNTGGRYCAQSPLMAQSAFSRKVHGAAGTFDIPLPLSGNVGVECRSGGATNDYQMIINFATTVTVGSASVTSGTGSVSSFIVTGSQVTVNLTGVTDAQIITVTLFNVNDGTHMGDVPVSMGVLVGDVNGNGVVNSSDVALTKSQVGQPVTGSNFREDVNANGTISSTDVAIVKSDVGTSLPP